LPSRARSDKACDNVKDPFFDLIILRAWVIDLLTTQKCPEACIGLSKTFLERIGVCGT
jgi:hypothetical protein